MNLLRNRPRQTIKVLRLRPDDTLVVNVGQRITQADAERISEVMKGKFPDHEVLVLDKDPSLEVARAAVTKRKER